MHGDLKFHLQAFKGSKIQYEMQIIFIRNRISKHFLILKIKVDSFLLHYMSITLNKIKLYEKKVLKDLLCKDNLNSCGSIQYFIKCNTVYFPLQ